MKNAVFIVVLLSLALPLAVSADLAPDCKSYCDNPQEFDGPPQGRTCICNPLEAKDFQTIIDKLIDFLFNIAIVLAPLMVVVAGFMFITAGGNPEQLVRAKNLIIWTAVGFAILLLSKGILAIINQILGVKGG